MRSKKLNKKSNIIGKNVKKYRIANKYTQEELCKKLDLYGLNLYHSDIYLIEHNKCKCQDKNFIIYIFWLK